MKKRRISVKELPRTEQLEAELKRERFKSRYRSTLRSTFFTLVIVAAVAVLIATLWLPVLQIYGGSMEPTFKSGEIVIALKKADIERGDITAFYYNNKILVKRAIAFPGEWIDIDEDGNVSINGSVIDEPYLTEKALGNCDIKLPYQVPESKIFVMGDQRETSTDSRSTAVGCVSEEQILGKIEFRVWPLTKIGRIE